MVNKNSRAYKFGRLTRRLVLVLVGYICGKRWGQKPINNLPKK